MPSTRSTARGDANSSPVSAKDSAGQKRKADAASPEGKTSKRGRQTKEQKTLEETLGTDAGESKQDDQTNGHAKQTNGRAEPSDAAQPSQTGEQAKSEEQKNQQTSSAQNGAQTSEQKPEQEHDVTMEDASNEDKTSALDQVKAEANEPGTTTKEDKKDEVDTQEQPTDDSKEAVQEDQSREQAMPSNILEKGIIYFFTRGRVGTDDPNSVQDLARSYFVLRPLPAGAKITEGSIQDAKTSRLMALPKKVWPKSGRDRFMSFVEKAKTDMKSLKEEFFQGSEYSTQTTGTRQTPPVTPVGEGVYAITTTGGGQGTTHLAYMLTIPSDISEVQKDLGLSDKGSFVLSLKNPESSGPANAALPEKPDWPKEYIEEFSGRSWMPVHPKHLDYANAQILLIGEDFESSNNLEAKPEDEKKSKETPEEELQKLEEEDEHRVEALKGDDSIFADLGLSSKDYPKVMTTW